MQPASHRCSHTRTASLHNQHSHETTSYTSLITNDIHNDSSDVRLASLRLPAWSSVHSWLLCLWPGPVSAPALLPAPTPVLHVSAPVRRGAVADARLGLA